MSEGLKSSVSEAIYDINHFLSRNIAKIPAVGDDFVRLEKLACDYLINPITFTGTFPGCDAVDDVYHGLPDLESDEAAIQR